MQTTVDPHPPWAVAAGPVLWLSALLLVRGRRDHKNFRQGLIIELSRRKLPMRTHQDI